MTASFARGQFVSALSCCACFFIACAAAPAQSWSASPDTIERGIRQQTSPVTAEASVERTRLAQGEIAISEDGRCVAFIEVHPRIEANTNTWDIAVECLQAEGSAGFAPRIVYQADSPALFFNMATYQPNAPVSGLKWVDGHHSLIFRRQPAFDDDATSIALLNVTDGSYRILQEFSGAVLDWSVSADGDVAALYLVLPQDPGRKKEMRENGFSVDKTLYQPYLELRKWQVPVRQIVVIRGLRKANPTTQIVETYREQLVRHTDYLPHLSLSPDGQSLIYLRVVQNPRPHWTEARVDEEGWPDLRNVMRPIGFGITQELTIYQLASDSKELAFNHPNVAAVPAKWSDDSEHFAVLSTSPLDAKNHAVHPQGAKAGSLVRQFHTVRRSDLRAGEVEAAIGAEPSSVRFDTILSWQDHGQTLVTLQGVDTIRTLHRESDRWRLASAVKLTTPEGPYWRIEPVAAGHSIVGRLENSQRPPDLFLWTGTALSSESNPITHLNEELKGFRFGKVEKISWLNKYGARSGGYLVYPPDFDPAKRYPAVLMLKDWTDGFIMDGQDYQTSFPAQILASNGIVVLLAKAPDAAYQPAVGPGKMGYLYNEMATVEAAIDLLDRRGVVNKDRIGISGFSVTSWQTQFILTHSKFRFGAASTADGWNLNYVSYATANLHQSSQSFDAGEMMDRLYGGMPYGPTLRNWIEHAPAFNAQKVLAPVLTEACGEGVLPLALEWFTALHKEGKPVELYLYPDGQHSLQTPKERLASLQINVDWFRFWLQGYERDAPDYDPDRYVRWRELREQHEKNQRAETAAPLKRGSMRGQQNILAPKDAPHTD